MLSLIYILALKNVPGNYLGAAIETILNVFGGPPLSIMPVGGNIGVTTSGKKVGQSMYEAKETWGLVDYVEATQESYGRDLETRPIK
jgi:hypothetical protein